MRHRVAGWKLGRNTEHRRALLRNLATSLIVEERIETTVTKAKAMRSHVEKMITLGKRGDVAARRLAAGYLTTRSAVDKLFDTISPRFGDREGGYTRIVLTGLRKGDGGQKAFIELLGSEKTSTPSAKSVPKLVLSAPKRPARPWKRRAPNRRLRPRAAARRTRRRSKASSVASRGRGSPACS